MDLAGLPVSVQASQLTAWSVAHLHVQYSCLQVLLTGVWQVYMYTVQAVQASLYVQSGLQTICLNTCWQAPITVQASLASACTHDGRSPCTVQASLPVPWPVEHLLVLMLSGFSVHYKVAHLQPGL